VLRKDYRQVEEQAMHLRWKQHYAYALNGCSHGKDCGRSGCLVGNRVMLQPFLAGCILPMWELLQRLRKGPVKICRVRINDGSLNGTRLVGMKVDGKIFQARLAEVSINLQVTRTNNQGQPVEGQLERPEVASPPRRQRPRLTILRRPAAQTIGSDDEVVEEDDEVLVIQPAARDQPARARSTRHRMRVIEDDDGEPCARAPRLRCVPGERCRLRSPRSPRARPLTASACCAADDFVPDV
jgi:hypothetical protein